MVYGYGLWFSGSSFKLSPNTIYSVKIRLSLDRSKTYVFDFFDQRGVIPKNKNSSKRRLNGSVDLIFFFQIYIFISTFCQAAN